MLSYSAMTLSQISSQSVAMFSFQYAVCICLFVCLLLLLFFLTGSLHVNELLIRNESESQGGSLTDSVEELLKGMYMVCTFAIL